MVRALFVLLLLSGCADMPRGRHGERLDVRSGWLSVTRVGEHCMWQQREYAARISCTL